MNETTKPAATKDIPQVPPPNGADVQAAVNQQLAQSAQEAKFWKLKYFELHQHTSQVISMLAAPFAQGEIASQLAALGIKKP